MKKLNINGNSAILSDVGELNDPVKVAVKRFECHPSILNIKEKVNIESRFSFSEVNNRDVALIIKNLNAKKLALL